MSRSLFLCGGSFGSLYQHLLPERERTPEEDASFKPALGVMGDLYASLLGTTVLQLKEIPSSTLDGYNARPYDERGWCCFEDAVSSELLVRLNPKLQNLLNETLADRPKVLLLTSAGPPKNVAAHRDELHGRVLRVESRIRASHFTGKGDKELVIELYRKYAARIAGQLQTMLHMTDLRGALDERPPPPSVSLSEDERATFLLEPLHPLLLVTPTERVHGHEGALTLHLVDGSTVHNALHQGTTPLLFDRCSHSVLPWRPPTAGWDQAFAADLQVIRSLMQDLGPEQLALAQASVQHASPPVAKLLPALNERNVRKRRDTLEAGALDAAAAMLTHYRLAGLRRYSSGQMLAVRRDDGTWVDAQVVSQDALGVHSMSLDGGHFTLEHIQWALHPWNHGPREMPLSKFEVLRSWYFDDLRSRHRHLVDAISGNRLDVLQQCVAIDVDGKLQGVSDASTLVCWLHAARRAQCGGTETELPTTAALLTAGPAAGKTSLLSQVVVYSLDQDALDVIPIVVRVQLLQTDMMQTEGVFKEAWNWVEAHLRLQHEHGSQLYLMLRQALVSRRALLLIDGLDEGGKRRKDIERHVSHVVAPQGHLMLATSRPDGIEEGWFQPFHRLHLTPLTAEQQATALEQRLGDRAARLIPYLERVPVDSETGQRITANPLMLSMVSATPDACTSLEKVSVAPYDLPSRRWHPSLSCVLGWRCRRQWRKCTRSPHRRCLHGRVLVPPISHRSCRRCSSRRTHVSSVSSHTSISRWLPTSSGGLA